MWNNTIEYCLRDGPVNWDNKGLSLFRSLDGRYEKKAQFEPTAILRRPEVYDKALENMDAEAGAETLP